MEENKGGMSNNVGMSVGTWTRKRLSSHKKEGRRERETSKLGRTNM